MKWPADCILFSSADWHTAYWTNKQHTAQRLADRGWRVLYVESVGLRTPSMASGRDRARLWRRLWRGLRTHLLGPPRDPGGVFVASPLTLPFSQSQALVRGFNQALLRAMLRRFMRRHGFCAPVVWTYHPHMLDAVRGIQGPLVYHCADDLGAVPGVDDRAFRAAEERLLKRCDVAFATSRPLEARCRDVNANTHYLPNVADADHFGRALEPGPLPPELQEIPRPRIGYHGVLSDFKVDFELLRAIAAARPDWHIVLIGDEREGQSNAVLQALRAMANVHVLGHRAYARLPGYLRGIDVGLLPTLINAYTRSMFPMKFYEYLAAGVPVAATPLAFADEPREGLATGSGAAAFAAAVEAQLARGRLSAEEARSAVGENQWDARLDKMLAIIEHLRDTGACAG